MLGSVTGVKLTHLPTRAPHHPLTHARAHAHKQTHACALYPSLTATHPPSHPRTRVHKHAHTHTHTHTLTHPHTHTSTHTHAHAHTHTRAHTHTHSHTHSHTHVRMNALTQTYSLTIATLHQYRHLLNICDRCETMEAMPVVEGRVRHYEFKTAKQTGEVWWKEYEASFEEIEQPIIGGKISFFKCFNEHDEILQRKLSGHGDCSVCYALSLHISQSSGVCAYAHMYLCPHVLLLICLTLVLVGAKEGV